MKGCKHCEATKKPKKVAWTKEEIAMLHKLRLERGDEIMAARSRKRGSQSTTPIFKEIAEALPSERERSVASVRIMANRLCYIISEIDHNIRCGHRAWDDLVPFGMNRGGKREGMLKQPGVLAYVEEAANDMITVFCQEAIDKAEEDGTALLASCPSRNEDTEKFLALVQDKNPPLMGELGQATCINLHERATGVVLEMRFCSELFFHLFEPGKASRKSLETLLESLICEPVEVCVILDAPPIHGSLDAESEREVSRGN